MGKIIDTDILIIGAGLSGLATAYYLKDSGLKLSIVDSRNRLGGRIKSEGFEDGNPIELGATWLGSKHQMLMKLLEALKVEVFPQFIGGKAHYEAISTSPPYLAQLPPNPEPTLRIKNGSMSVIEALADQLEKDKIKLNTKIEKLVFKEDGVEIFAEAMKINAKKVVSTIPPKLLVNSLEFEPSLSEEFMLLANVTHTWMSQSIKIALRYKNAFWRAENLSGTIFSNVGPIPEMYEHSNHADTDHALMGFFDGNYHSITREERLEMVLAQLRKYYGEKADEYVSYHEEVWSKNKHTHYPYQEHVLPHQNNGHPTYRDPLYDNKLFVSGTETSSHFPGYMEGAIFSAVRTANKIKAD